MQAPSRAEATRLWLLAATFAVAVAGLIYELIAATAASYLLGDSIRQFSLVIGVFLAAMGAGAAVSRYVGDALHGFVVAQTFLGVVGAATAPGMFVLFAMDGPVSAYLYLSLSVLGILSGLEIPLLTRLLKEEGAGEFRFENVLTVDYLGALAASLAFPFLILPRLGLVSAGLTFGVLNLAVAGLTIALFVGRIHRGLVALWALAMVAGLAALVQSAQMTASLDARLYEDEVILSERTPYQTITLTRAGDAVRLYLNGGIQFDSRDEYRYHEALVHPAMAKAPRRASVLILGGGDGMAIREVLRWPDVEQVTLVDLDPAVTELFRSRDTLAALNGFAFRDPRVEVVNTDAFVFAGASGPVFDVVIADLPDPRTPALSRLYAAEFYARLSRRLSPRGVMVTQAGSPFFARAAFWTIVTTLETMPSPAGPGTDIRVVPYQTYLPSFGQWGFALVEATPLAARPLAWPEGLRYLTQDSWQAAQVFAADTDRIETTVNTMQSHDLLRAYESGWSAWFD